MGTYKDGKLVCKTKEGKLVGMNNNRKFVRFDGRLPHKVQYVTGGDRYSFVFYKNYDRKMNGCPLRILACPQYMIGKGEFQDVGYESDEWYDNLSFEQKIKVYGTIVDVLPDGNCGYHAVLHLLKVKQLVDRNIPINAFRKAIRNYINPNKDFVPKALEYVASFRDRLDKEERIERFLTLISECIYAEDICFNDGANEDH